MKQSILKKIRLVIAIIIFLFTFFAFIDFRGVFSPHFLMTITSVQFVPSLIEALKTGVIFGGAFIVILFLTALFGRVYCSAICPLGILQDGIARIKKRIRKKKFRYKPGRTYNILRYSILGVTIVSMIAGSILIVNLLDPYSNFGRISSDLIRPIYISLNNLLAGILEKMNIYTFYKMDIYVNWLALIYPLVIFGLITFLTLKHGRLFCNTICPVGALLGLLSKISLFKLKFDTQKCTSCNKCSLVCKSECINIKEQKVDFTRCVACYNCIDTCPESAIKYQLSLRKGISSTNSPDKEDNGRLEFIGKAVSSTMILLGISKLLKGTTPVSNTGVELIPNDKKYAICPPGSVSIDRFNDICTACHLCVSACPSNVIHPSLLEYGLKGFLQPRLDYEISYCNYECTACSEVCPTGAIRPITRDEKVVTQIGKVNFIQQNCVVYTEETSCGACAEHCPTQAVFMVPYKEGLTIPNTNPSICVGCGACEHICPVRPHRAIFVDGNSVHLKAEKPKIEEVDYEELEEFPF
ncbi:MAG: 4Fe-4S binding protein [Bacteroidales bacterium]|nr:4Fe-4S binding protein [Bacteroidales bacterium]